MIEENSYDSVRKGHYSRLRLRATSEISVLQRQVKITDTKGASVGNIQHFQSIFAWYRACSILQPLRGMGAREDLENVRDDNSSSLDSDASGGIANLSVQRQLGLLPQRYFGHGFNSLVDPGSGRQSLTKAQERTVRKQMRVPFQGFDHPRRSR